MLPLRPNPIPEPVRRAPEGNPRPAWVPLPSYIRKTTHKKRGQEPESTSIIEAFWFRLAVIAQSIRSQSAVRRARAIKLLLSAIPKRYDCH